MSSTGLGHKIHVDPVTLEVVRNSLVAIVNEMTENLIRTAYSAIAAEVKDFSVGLVDAKGNAVAQALNGLPVFVADLGNSIRAGLEAYASEGFQPGDMIVANDINSNGQHLNNVAVYSPLFIEGELFAFPAVRSHWSDVGGIVPGSMSTEAREIFAEGIQLPSLKVYRAGVPDEAILRLIKTNTRFPELVLGDMRAQISACRLGERRLTEMVAKYGKDAVTACIHKIWDEDERIARRAVEEIPDGEYTAETVLDSDGINLDKPVPLKVKVTVKGSDMNIDFSEMSPQVEGPYNSRGAAGAETVSRVAFKYLTSPFTPASEGAFRNLTYTVPEGTIISARENAALGWWTLAIVSTIDLVIKAVYPVMPDRVKAGDSDNISAGTFCGVDPRNSRRFMTFLPVVAGMGATHRNDGINAVVSLAQGDVQLMPVEVQENLYPVGVTEFGLREDSGGPGKQRGGLGVRIVRQALTDSGFDTSFDRTRDPPWGLAGGSRGKPTQLQLVDNVNGTAKDMPYKAVGYPVPKGQIVLVESAGGGGFGPPLERDPETVRTDVIEGYVSRKSAQADYGVVFVDDSFEIDLAATEALRKAMGDAAGTKP